MLNETPKRKFSLNGVTYEIKNPAHNYSVFVTINDMIVSGRKKTCEIFIHTKNTEHIQWICALEVLLSSILLKMDDSTSIFEELLCIVDPKDGFYFFNGEQIPSTVAHISKILLQHHSTVENYNKQLEINAALEEKNNANNKP